MKKIQKILLIQPPSSRCDLLVGGKEKEAMNEIRGHMELVTKCCRNLPKAYDLYIEGSEEDFERKAREMREIEKEADEARRQVELTIHSGAFMPIYREDYLSLAELIDKVADDCVSVTNLMLLAGFKIPEKSQEDISHIIDRTVESVETLDSCIGLCIDDRQKAHKTASKVEEIEESIDDEEFRVRSTLYRMSIDGYQKILLNDLVDKIGNISDAAEDASDRIVIMITKRD